MSRKTPRSATSCGVCHKKIPLKKPVLRLRDGSTCCQPCVERNHLHDHLEGVHATA